MNGEVRYGFARCDFLLVFSVISAWNALPSSVRSAPSLLQFRRDLKTALHVSVIVLFTIVSCCVTDYNF